MTRGQDDEREKEIEGMAIGFAMPYNGSFRRRHHRSMRVLQECHIHGKHVRHRAYVR